MALGDAAIIKVDHIVKFGRNENVLNSPTLIANDGVTLANWEAPAAAATNVVSTAVGDTAAGTGARTVRVTGIDGGFQYQEEVVPLDGTTQVDLTTQFFRVWRVEVVTAGSGDLNLGTLDVRHGTTVLARITIGDNQTTLAALLVPTGHVALIKSFYGEIEKAGGQGTFITFKLWTRKFGEARRLRFVFSGNSTGSSHILFNLGEDLGHEKFRLDPGECVWIEGTGSTNGLTGNAGFDLHFKHRGA